ncbi:MULTISPECIES: ABC transporter permease [unclassified Myxococcus]|uniref:ABC transporter permease n=1 Tax=unclassified Myxococcus TaxID=2648731 RepID=UPI00157A4203|nr:MULTISPECIES: ABC transporter permease [unclassified Myxococcus]NTX01435.1 ABC transporter permease subunit [Myxococcus sp. CA040A]NTX15539.1 ABC transporter permease subunit [Myxococcus sp. CA056]NTX32873.1 ABC transporter permease subunit [Myxococcus sp. CA033]NTX55120.1 ABC transporter permease subunit [Myxococcus sp. CA039A]
MRIALAIARKELSLFFTTPWAYGVFTAMVALSSFFFVNLLATFQQVQEQAREVTWAMMPPDMTAYRNLTDGVMVQLWGMVIIITLFIAPFLSMRLFAEEKRNKTFELLMTAPVRPIEIVLGKYLGGLGIISATLGLTLIFPLVLSAFGHAESGTALEWPTVLLGYGGILLWGATCMAVGMFISALTESQMLAAFLTFAVLLPWMLLSGVAQATEEPLRSVLTYLSFDAQLQNMLKGILDVQTLVFFASVIVFSLLLTHRTVEARRWA